MQWPKVTELLTFLNAEVTSVYYHAQFYVLLGTEPRALCMLRKYSNN